MCIRDRYWSYDSWDRNPSLVSFSSNDNDLNIFNMRFLVGGTQIESSPAIEIIKNRISNVEKHVDYESLNNERAVQQLKQQIEKSRVGIQEFEEKQKKSSNMNESFELFIHDKHGEVYNRGERIEIGKNKEDLVNYLNKYAKDNNLLAPQGNKPHIVLPQDTNLNWDWRETNTNTN